MRFVTLQIGQALLARALFLGHSLLAVAHTANVLGDPLWWLLALANVGLLVETVFTVIKRQGREWRWICPSAVCYLLATVPAICLLELDQLDRHFNAFQNVSGPIAENASVDADLPTNIDLDWVGEWLGVSIKLSRDMWVEVIEQLLLLLLIIGRWLMPKGEISRDELSQLLFVYIAIASDIMELFELFEEEKIYQNTALRFAILAVWGISLCQFTLVLTASRNPKKARAVASPQDPQDAATACSSVVCCKVPYIEILSLLTSLMIMDGPFLAIRLYCLISLELLTYNILFFTSKNLLMVMLLLYRFVVILNDIRKKRHVDDEISIHSMKLPHDSQSITSNSSEQGGVQTEDVWGIKTPRDLEVSILNKSNPGEDQKPEGSLDKGSKLQTEDKKVQEISKDRMSGDSSYDDYVMFEKEDLTSSTVGQRSGSLDPDDVQPRLDHCLRESNSFPECDQKSDHEQEVSLTETLPGSPSDNVDTC